MVHPMTHFRRASWTVVLVLLHLFITPCATAMMLMPADMDCEHCETMNGSDACAIASAEADSVIKGVAFDSGPAYPPVPAGQHALLLPVSLPVSLPETLTPALRSRFVATRHTGDPPLYLLFVQFLI